ncbi:hypothetical protein LCGC14_2789750, partial [marine sediment metagenome]
HRDGWALRHLKLKVNDSLTAVSGMNCIDSLSSGADKSKNFVLEAGRTYKVHAGSIDGYCFLFVDGAEIVALQDPDPIDNSKYGKIGFTAWSSHIQIRNIIVRQISWKHLDMEYKSEFHPEKSGLNIK